MMFYTAYSFKGVINEESGGEIIKISRQMNTCADFFTRKALNEKYGMQVLYSPPIRLLDLLKKDVQSTMLSSN